MNQFLKRYNLPKVTQVARQLENAYVYKEIKSILNLPKQETPSQDGFTDKFYQTGKEEITPILFNLFQKIKAVPNSFYEATLP